MPIRAVISDFGGVLTTPLLRSFVAFQDETGIASEALGSAMQRAAERDGAYPLFELEKGRMTRGRLPRALRDRARAELGHRPELHRFSEIYFEALDPNEPMVELMRSLRDRGYRMALLTNNVREWEPLWRSMLPVDEIFELIVDSGVRRDAKAGARDLRADPGAARRRPAAEECLFIDDVEVQLAAARELGMRRGPLPRQRAGDSGDRGGAGRRPAGLR